MTNEPTLLPCPFCGEAVHLAKATYEGGSDYICHNTNLERVNDCGMSYSDFFTDDIVKAWNTRTPRWRTISELPTPFINIQIAVVDEAGEKYVTNGWYDLDLESFQFVQLDMPTGENDRAYAWQPLPAPPTDAE